MMFIARYLSMSNDLYGIDIKQSMPESFRTDHIIWDKYISSIWLSIFKFCNIQKNDSIIEIGPGNSIKIGYALSQLNFCGTLYIIDALPEVIDTLKPKYEELLPNAKIIWLDKPVIEAIKTLPKHIDYILANHVLDDMLIYAAKHSDALTWSKSYTHIPSNDLQESWQEISKDINELKQAQSMVSKEIINLINQINPTSIILNQYPSATLNDHGMISLNNAAIDILNMIKDEADQIEQAEVQNILNLHPHYNNHHIGQHVLNAKYWTICKKI